MDSARNVTPAPTVLAIDDSVECRILLRKALESRGSNIRLLVVDDGVEGIEAARFYHPSCVVLDLRLPTMNGRDVLRALAEDPQTARIPTVVVTGDADAREEILALGATDFVAKPYNVFELADRVLALCGSQ